jgi:hypothetical protein
MPGAETAAKQLSFSRIYYYLELGFKNNDEKGIVQMQYHSLMCYIKFTCTLSR